MGSVSNISFLLDSQLRLSNIYALYIYYFYLYRMSFWGCEVRISTESSDGSD